MLEYKIDVLEALRNKGFTSYRIRKEKLLSESTLQKLRNRQPIAWENIDSLCKMLDCQPADLIKYEKEAPAE